MYLSRVLKLRSGVLPRSFAIDKCQPDAVHVCDGSDTEYAKMCNALVQSGTFIPLNHEKRPNSYIARSDPRDVARVVEKTYVCSANEADAGSHNNWRAPDDMRKTLDTLMQGSMKGRTMYVIPFSMGPVTSGLSMQGIEVTDSPYVVANMKLMTRMGDEALDKISETNDFVRCMHSVGYPLTDGKQDVAWPCNPEHTLITHFPNATTSPDESEIVSFGSGYGGNALLGKKCLALRIASVRARDEGWMAEHMLIAGIRRNPGENFRYIAAAFPSACGKTNLAMLESVLPGWEVKCVGDDIAWMRVNEKGELRAINPEAGFFGVAPGTSDRTNPNAMATLYKDAIFTNCALTPDGDVFWQGMDTGAKEATTWRGEAWKSSDPKAKNTPAHDNARFTVSARQCPILHREAFDSDEGVPIEAILFGARRSSLVPLVVESRSWAHGIYLGLTMRSEATAAEQGGNAQLKYDPMAMRPFCGYDFGDYAQHWLDMGERMSSPPSVFHVNWFRRDDDGSFIWPGFGENARVLNWVLDRVDGTADAVDTPIGLVPADGAIEGAAPELVEVDAGAWAEELKSHDAHLANLSDRIPDEVLQEHAATVERLHESSSFAAEA